MVPDFLIELRFTTDRLGDLQIKMLEYQRLGVKLGLLINPQDKQVEIYRIGREVDVIQSPYSFAGSVPEVIDCQDVLSGFNLDLKRIL